MRFLVPFTLALSLPIPALADQIQATSRITAVTVFPEGAEITREVVFAAPAGSHELMVIDLPLETPPELIRLLPQDGMGLGAFALRTDRLPPAEDDENPRLQAAKDAVEAAKDDERAASAAVEAVDARVQAAEARAGFLGAVKADGGALTPEAITALADMIGTEMLAAKEAALAAKADRPAAEKALEAAQKARTKAEEALAAVLTGAENVAALSVAVTLPAAGDHRLTVTHFAPSASWSPVYDLMLTRNDPELLVKRGVLVTQYTGEDWRGVDLTLSTARPSAQSAPTTVYPEQRWLADPAEMAKRAADAGGMAEAVMEPSIVEATYAPVPVETALAGFQGDTVVYHYPSQVDVATGVDNLKLALDEKRFIPEIHAEAVPRFDSTAFLMAKFRNDSGEVLLPGTAFVMREGVLVGATELGLLAPGAEVTLAFGAIEGLRLKHEMPRRAEGDRGLLSTETERSETVVLQVENLTNEVWPIRLVDRIPYSEQEDLEISLEADPSPTETDPEGKRGLLAWRFDMAPGEKKAVTLTHRMRWPEGMILQ